MRIFVIGRDWADKNRRLTILQTMLQHRLLSFQLRVAEKHELDRVFMASVGEVWDSVAWQSDQQNLLVRYSSSNLPEIIRTTGCDHSNALLRAHRTLWENSLPFENWCKVKRLDEATLRELEDNDVAHQLEAIGFEQTSLNNHNWEEKPGHS